MKRIGAGLLLALALAGPAMARPVFSGPDFSGQYACRFLDVGGREQPANLMLRLRPEQSREVHGAYDLRLDLPGRPSLKGHAAARKLEMALHYAAPGGEAATGIATLRKTKARRWGFSSFYYGPGFMGGVPGLKECRQR